MSNDICEIDAGGDVKVRCNYSKNYIILVVGISKDIYRLVFKNGILNIRKTTFKDGVNFLPDDRTTIINNFFTGKHLRHYIDSLKLLSKGS